MKLKDDIHFWVSFIIFIAIPQYIKEFIQKITKTQEGEGC